VSAGTERHIEAEPSRRSRGGLRAIAGLENDIDMTPLPRIALCFLATALTGCGKSGANATAAQAAAAFDERSLPVPAEPTLALGQRVYRGDCYNCHDLGKKGAPRIADRAAWAPRLAQGLDPLVQHATAGFAGPSGSEMPARGGNDALTDTEIAAAVRYLTSHAR
jgi:cytochrome c5